jgi:5,10-methylenetetrahydromethanopterin reductase
MREQWHEAGRPLTGLSATAFVLGFVLHDGEPADSERAVAQAGPRAAVMLHRAADEALSGLPAGTIMPSKSRDELEGYVALARTFEPVDAPYLQNHRGHLMFVKPEERPYVTAALIRATSLTATESEIKTRIDALRGAGYTQFTIQIVPGQEEAIADWARIREAFA